MHVLGKGRSTFLLRTKFNSKIRYQSIVTAYCSSTLTKNAVKIMRRAKWKKVTLGEYRRTIEVWDSMHYESNLVTVTYLGNAGITRDCANFT